MSGKFALVVHGWKEGVLTAWVEATIQSLLKYRGGCVFFMDYSRSSNVSDYFKLTPHFKGLAAVKSIFLRLQLWFKIEY